ncbi:Echinoderm microtubule-associated protein-like 1 [Larimichthys crocea]|uniref:Echinoderm microtubule-associated protein-like 1 n=1 Tax=Larimichthys crocea TaxID=215358 RepID=A0A6G0IEL6_LARCR|nr:Echinoderm microtubule-associated protein-like 1 [Larimichthys crocea]
MEVTDRIASLEQRVQMQEDEIQLLKSALADVVRRLNVSEEQQAMGSRRGPTKEPAMMKKSPSADSSVGKPGRLTVESVCTNQACQANDRHPALRPTVNNGTILPKKGSGTLPSPSGSGSRKDTSTPANKSTVRRANSNEHVGTLTRKDSSDSKGNRTRAGSTGSNSSGKRSDSKQRDPVFNAVTVQIYLSRSAKRTGTSGKPVASAITARSATNPQQTSESNKASMAKKGGPAKVPAARKTPNFSIQLRKSGSLSSYSPLDTPSYRSPIKSPSQYFQICY